MEAERSGGSFIWGSSSGGKSPNGSKEGAGAGAGGGGGKMSSGALFITFSDLGWGGGGISTGLDGGDGSLEVGFVLGSSVTFLWVYPVCPHQVLWAWEVYSLD